jgi:RHS repeat-associated protein
MTATPQIRLGGRAVEELVPACDAEVDVRTGAAVVSVPIPLSEGRSGFTPSLSLTYSSAAGNSVFGMGWGLAGVAPITVGTTDGLPRHDGHDRFSFAGGDELVPALERAGSTWRPRVEDRGEFVVSMFRSRTEQGRLRFEQWRQVDTGRVHWRVRDADNLVTVYGRDPSGAGRIADPQDPARRTFAWLPESQHDPDGNAIRFMYLPETSDGLDPSRTFEHGFRDAAGFAQRYLKRVLYGNTAPVGVDGADPADLRWHFEVVLDYGDHSDPVAPGVRPDSQWPARPDPFSTFRPGFEVRTHRLCRRILMFHHFDELGPDETLVWSTVLEHTESPLGTSLSAVRHTGFRRAPPGSTEPPRRALPPLSFRYSTPDTDDAFTAPTGGALENVPQGLNESRLHWTDLFGEGLPGILAEAGSAWYYKRNEGGGRFGAQQVVAVRPLHPAAGRQLTDFDGDGNTDSVVLQGRHAGFCSFDRETERWEAFRPFRALPHLESSGARAQWIDLDGDGRPDLVLSQADRFTWYPSKGQDGFGPAVEIPKPQSPGMVQAQQVAENVDLEFFFVDLNGDGLLDLVRAQNGRVEYWPQIGHGRFGDGVLMESSPRFDSDEQFDPRRLHFADLDGTRTADILYVGRGEVRRWMNAGGNRLMEADPIRPAPYIENLASVRVLDFLGDGTSCLVWSSSLPGVPSAIRFLRLTGGIVPQLLLSVDNGMGQEVRFTYSSSASHYLRDLRGGRSWRSKLPSHTVVVDRREVVDQVAGARSVSHFEYHDGRFDGTRRAFGGFTLVDQYDMEVRGDAPSLSAVPSCTRTWFHPGSSPAAPVPDAYGGDTRAPMLAPHEFEDLRALSPEECADGLRGLAGQVIRQEVYAAQPSGVRAAHPFHVTQSSYRLRRLQPPDKGMPASFDFHLRERLTSVYEQQPDDPRHAHHLTLELDPFGNPTLEATVAYPRRAPPPGAPPAQRAPTLTIAVASFVNVDDADRHELGIPIERREFEAAGLSPAPAEVFTAGTLTRSLRPALQAPLDDHEPFTSGVQVRLASWDQTYYWDTAATAALGLGSVGAPTLVHHEESACFTTTFVSQVFGGRVDATLLTDDGAYTERNGYWWRVDPTHRFAGPAGFRQLEGIERPDGAVTTFRYDPHRVAVVEVGDALQNRTLASIDYHLVAAAAVTDANDNITEVRCDPLGVAVTTSRHGQLLGPNGPRPYGHDPLSTYVVQADETVSAVLADPARFVGGAQSFVAYDLDAWSTVGLPVCAVTVQREHLVHDGRGGGGPATGHRVTVGYRDGFGRSLQTRLRVEPGPAVQRGPDGRIVVDAGGVPVLASAAERWLVSGHVSYDAKQQPTEEHEPYFSDRPAYEADDELRRFGVSSISVYDAVGRLVQELLPSGTFTRIVYASWQVERHDPNDTVQDSRYRAQREFLADSDPEKQALRKAQAHAGTPTVVHLDPEGREVRVVEAGAAGERRVVDRTLHHGGTPVAVGDPRGLTAFAYALDLQGRVLRTDSVDAGRSLVLFDAFDRPVHEWDARGVHRRREFDRLDRPLAVTVDGALGLNHRVEELRYGDDPVVSQAAPRNARGRLERHRDSAGVVLVQRYDPDGTVLRSERQLRRDFRAEVNWAAPDVALETGSFVSERVLDALGRVREETLPDGSVRRVEHRAGGGVRRVRMSTADGMLSDVEILKEADYTPRGQRATAVLGNDVELMHEYDPETFWTRRVLARPTAPAAAPALLDLSYTHDAIGNITHAVDAAQEPANATPLLQGLTVSSAQDFTYDPYYQLERAEGRVHQALLEHDYRPNLTHPGGSKGTRHLTLNNGAAVERYTQTYSYDLAGNLEWVRHQGSTRSWTTDLWISGSSNRSLPALDPNGNSVTGPEARFDPAGNCQQLAHLRLLEYDHRGALARAVLVQRAGPDAVDDAEHYVYGGDGTRVRKVLETVVPTGTEIVEKLYLDGCEIKRIRRGTQLLLERRTSHLSDGVGRIALVHRWTVDSNARETDDISQPRFHYQVTNHLGTAVLDLDATGGVIGYEEYFPFGGTAFLAGDRLREVERREYRYCGKERDDATGLYYFEYRYYAPWIGHWLSPDPIGPQDTLNLYAYVLNNPINLVDPEGLQATAPSGGRLVTLELTPQEQAFLDERRQQAFNRLPAARQQELLRRGSFFSFNRELQFRFFTEREARAEIRRLAEREPVGILRRRRPPPREQAPPPRPPTPPPGTPEGDPLALMDPPRDVAPPPGGGEDEAREQASATSTATSATGTAADAKDTSASADAAATGQGVGDGGGEGGGTAESAGNGLGERGTGPGGGGTATTPGRADAGPGTAGGGLGREGTGAGADEATAADETAAPEDPDATATGDDGPATTSSETAGEISGNGTQAVSEATAAQVGGDPGGAGGTGGTGERPGAGGSGPAGGEERGDAQDPRRGRAGGAPGQRREPPTALDRATRVAGWLNLEFSGSKEGVSGGIPGGFGRFNFGAPAQAAYIVLTAASFLLGGAIKALVKGITKFGLKAALSRAVAAARAFLPAAKAALAKVMGRITSRVGGWLAGLARKLSTAVTERGSRTFFSVQGPGDVVRLLTRGGHPWPSGFRHNSLSDIFGRGLYTFATRGQAEQYMELLIKRGALDLKVLAHKISARNLERLATADLTRMTDDAASAILELGAEHGFQHIVRLTGRFGVEHFFRQDVYHLFTSWIVR